MAYSHAAPNDVESTISYLARHVLWDTEKPYIADFPLDAFKGAELTNQIIRKHRVTIHDVRGISHAFTLDKNGFCFVKGATCLTADAALTDAKGCEESYFEEIETLMQRHFPGYTRFECIDLTVRQRDPTFPWEGEVKLIKHEQPAAVAHSDYSVEGAFMELQAVFPGKERYFQDRAFDILNVWRPLRGPNDDWPLALCDAETIDRSTDLRLSDVVHFNRVGENILLHANQAHRWYYMSAQDVDECIVFRNCDSSGLRARGSHRPPKSYIHTLLTSA
ncbi:MAG: hypothetical protein Q9161_009054 [Pseudevernia consocians]